MIEGDSDRHALHFLHHIRIILNDGQGDELLLMLCYSVKLFKCGNVNSMSNL